MPIFEGATAWGKIPIWIRRKMRLALIARDGLKCHHCGVLTRMQTVAGSDGSRKTTIDHYPIPKRELPRDKWLDPNCAVIACLSCNRGANEKKQGESK